MTAGCMLRAGHRQQPSAAPQQPSHQKETAPEIEMPQLEFLKPWALAQGVGKCVCCRDIIHLIDCRIVRHVCNLCAMQWRSILFVVVLG